MVDAEYSLASMGAGEVPPQSPVKSTKEFFDNYADNFDNKLVTTLKYETPQHIYDSVAKELGDDPKNMDILDLGCGTGLCGALFADHANRLIGVDLSPRMLKKAGHRSIYTDLVQSDVCQFLEKSDVTYDLILSGDVFVYIGDLGRCFALIHDCLNSGGIFAFSIEVNKDGKDYLLTPTDRYAQSTDYIRRLITENNYSEVSSNSVILRYDDGLPVSGCIFVLQKAPD